MVFAALKNPLSSLFSASPPPHIIIWVHGTRSHDIFPPTYVVNTKKIPHTEKKPFYTAYSPPGLHNALTIDKNLHVATIAQALHDASPSRHYQEHIYLFGWSGDFTPKARSYAGFYLYQELKKLTALYKQHFNYCPPLTLITHSHGGNVALECVPFYDHTLSIDHLILLACPVQEKTKPYTRSPLFNHIYSIHSDKDYFQILDMQGFHPVWNAVENAFNTTSLKPLKTIWRNAYMPTKLLSERHFPYQPNLKQACIEWKKNSIKWSLKDLAIMNPFLSEATILTLQKKLHEYDYKKRSLMHIEFLFPTFLQQLPSIIKTLDTTFLPAHSENPSIVIKI